MHKSTLGEAYMKELQVVLKHTLLATLVTHVGTLSSGITLDDTCIQIDLDLLNPFVDKPIDCLDVTVPSRTTLGKILSSSLLVG
jgi:hypothetical protein